MELRDTEVKSTKIRGLPRYQSTLTRELMLDIIYRISEVNTKGGVSVYEND